jgi:hypothetical protein
MNDNQDISYTKPEDITAQGSKSQSTKEYVKKLTDYMKDENKSPLSDLKFVETSYPAFKIVIQEKLPEYQFRNATKDEQDIINAQIFQLSQPKESDSKHGGLRYNQGKLRYDLICPEQLKGLASVYTYGATKYKPHNWSKGQAYSTILASLKRHIAAFEAGEDYDAESKCQHMAHAMWNCGALISFAKFYPQGDDRRCSWQRIPRIGLDIDETVADFVKAYCNRYSLPIPHCWNFDPLFSERIAELKEDRAFWLNLEPLIKPEELPFEPAAYITSRVIPNEWTQEWLWSHGFPVAPVITVRRGESKAQHIQDLKLDWFCDDSFSTFSELNKQGICCFLIDAKHNQRYDVGSKRIKSLFELKERW